jgi:hypothetical protein
LAQDPILFLITGGTLSMRQFTQTQKLKLELNFVTGGIVIFFLALIAFFINQ